MNSPMTSSLSSQLRGMTATICRMVSSSNGRPPNCMPSRWSLAVTIACFGLVAAPVIWLRLPVSSLAVVTAQVVEQLSHREFQVARLLRRHGGEPETTRPRQSRRVRCTIARRRQRGPRARLTHGCAAAADRRSAAGRGSRTWGVRHRCQFAETTNTIRTALTSAKMTIDVATQTAG